MIKTRTLTPNSNARRSLLAVFALGLCLSGCQNKGRGSAPGASSTPNRLRFAFVTNNSSDFWNIATKGVNKAKTDLGIDAEVFRPLKGEVSDQQRFLDVILAAVIVDRLLEKK